MKLCDIHAIDVRQQIVRSYLKHRLVLCEIQAISFFSSMLKDSHTQTHAITQKSYYKKIEMFVERLCLV